MSNSLIFAFSNPVDGKEDAFNEWYDNQHLGELLDVPGVVAAQRYDLVPMGAPKGEAAASRASRPHRYLTIYEIDDDPRVVLKELGKRIAGGQFVMTDAIDQSTVAHTVWRPRSERRVAT